jgi:hypothetical protein
MEIINQYSILWSSLIILGLAAYFLLRKGYTPRKGLFVVVVAAILMIGWLSIRPEQASTTEFSKFEVELGQGRSVLLELQSPY